MTGTVIIDVFPSSVARFIDDHTVVAVDVIRATTVAVTAVAAGRRCLVATSLDDAFAMRRRLPDALLAGELGGDMPDGFDMNNSPTDVAGRLDVERPIVMLSSSGTQLMAQASGAAHGAYVACFRNFPAVARHLIGRHQRVAVIGAGSRNVFREEDQMACAWVAEILVRAGYRSADGRTQDLIERWSGAPAVACADSDSVGYLRRSGQIRDYGFVTTHVADLDLVCVIEGNEVLAR